MRKILQAANHTLRCATLWPHPDDEIFALDVRPSPGLGRSGISSAAATTSHPSNALRPPSRVLPFEKFYSSLNPPQLYSSSTEEKFHDRRRNSRAPVNSSPPFRKLLTRQRAFTPPSPLFHHNTPTHRKKVPIVRIYNVNKNRMMQTTYKIKGWRMVAETTDADGLVKDTAVRYSLAIAEL
ncbi:hypothetical protein U1Q18_049078 [Sarracenia purpurea var. burkii]